jgi:uncharacterized protein
MPAELTYPGVYIEEEISAVRTITGVSTSITAFIGRAIRGPVDKAITIDSFTEFERIYGGLWRMSNLGYAVDQYFLNGGNQAVIVRAHHEARKVEFTIIGSQLKLQSANPGLWGYNLKIKTHKIDESIKTERNDDTLVELRVEDTNSGQRETFIVSADPESPSFISSVLEDQSELIEVNENVQIPFTIPDDPDHDVPFESIDGSGSDGDKLLPDDILGSQAAVEKSGMKLLDEVDLFNLLCIPPDIPSYEDGSDIPKDVYDNALTYCDTRNAILIVDGRSSWTSVDKAANEIKDSSIVPSRHKNAAIWFPRIKMPDREHGNKLREFVPCGVIAGIIARTDRERGFWKSAAGSEARLIGVSDLRVKLTDDENGRLNPLGLNCIRSFDFAGVVNWGARTMVGVDQLADQWKYLAVRRTALYIKESLYRGTQWVVFEPNDERLWSQIRLNIGSFMQDLFLKGAFQGTDPKKAYFVKCDSETTRQRDIDLGIVNIIVGFAPLKPAEFVVIKLQQLTQVEAGI